ncbi:response regulator [Burkholderia thailandensis]|uniref:Response regulator n=1 Tax=Burkholderia thailandensis TaxID=57975 RepID=A0AAW9CSD4_BURTH|nr:response regulator [Burkholderia thailandensis]MDW9250719.1 response regulator [Burkholderia thailandensis]
MATRALREPRAHGHAATVLDLGLPRVEGMDVLQRIRRPSCA